MRHFSPSCILNTFLERKGKIIIQRFFIFIGLSSFLLLIAFQNSRGQTDTTGYLKAQKFVFDEDYANAILLLEKLEVRFFTAKNDTLYIDVLNNLALIHTALYHYDIAETYVQKALDFTQPTSSDSSLLFADVLSTKAYILFDQSQYGVAEKLCKQALNIYRNAGKTETPQFWKHLLRLEEIWSHIIENPRKDIIKNFVPNARLNDQRAAKIFKNGSFEHMYSKLWYGLTLSMSGDFDKSDSVMQIATKWSEQYLPSNHPKRFEFLFIKISALHTQIQRNNNINKNFELSQQAYQLACKIDSNGRRHALASFAMAYASITRFDLNNFTKYSNEGIRVFERVKGFHDIKFTLLNNHAQVLSFTQNHEDALFFYDKAHKALKEGDYLRNDDYSTFLRALGGNELERGLFKEANEHLSEAIRLLEKSNEDDTGFLPLAQTRLAMTIYYLTTQRSKEAFEQIQEVLRVYSDNIGSIPKMEYLNALFFKGVILEDLERDDESITLLVQLIDSIKINKLEKSLLNMNVKQRLAGIYIYKRQNLNEAEKLLEDADFVRQSLLKEDNLYDIFIKSNQAHLHFARKEGKKNIEAYQKTIQSAEQYLGKHYYLLEDLYRKYALSNYLFNDSDSVDASLRKVLHYIHMQTSNYLNFMSEEDRERYIQSTLKKSTQIVYNICFNEKPIHRNRLSIAYDIILHTKGLLLSSFQNTIRKVRADQDSTTITLLNNWVQLRTRLANEYLRSPEKFSQENTKTLYNAIEKAEKELSMKGANLKDLKEIKNYQWQDVKKSLKASEAAIEIVKYTGYDLFYDRAIDSVRYAALIIRPEWAAPHMVLLPNGKELENKWLQIYSANLTNPHPPAEIYQHFWAPLKKELKGIRKIFIAPDGVYHLISLPTLYNASSKRFLAEEMDIVVVGSTRDVITNDTESTSLTAELVGYPAYKARRDDITRQVALSFRGRQRSGMTFEELPATKTEVDTLQHFFQLFRLTPTVKTGIDANENALKSVASPRILHIATHGFFKDTLIKGISPLLACGLALAGAADTTRKNSPESDDGILTGYEASLLNLNKTELVTLSACDTGLGDVKAGEGVFGLQRAFLNSGAKAVLMSLWKLDDELMLEFMTQFYKNWLGGLSKPQALQRAQATMRSHYPEPRYWGNFVLLGK